MEPKTCIGHLKRHYNGYLLHCGKTVQFKIVFTRCYLAYNRPNICERFAIRQVEPKTTLIKDTSFSNHVFSQVYLKRSAITERAQEERKKILKQLIL